MSDIFISYAREDRGRAEQLARAFERQGWSVWWDKVIPPGRKYADVIGEELASAKAVIVLWSRASVASDWVKDEAQEGATRGVLVPVLVEKVSAPYGFRQLQTADLSEWDGSDASAELQGLLSGVADVIKKPVTEAGPAPEPERDRTRRSLTPFYLAAGVVLCLALAFAGYKYFTRTTDGGGHTDGGQTGGQTGGPCPADSRHKAAKFTSDGILMIDPGGNYDAAVLQFKEAISECADYADAYFWRGQSLIALNRSDEALRDFKTFLTLNPEPGAQLRTAQKLVADLEGPHATPTPAATPSNTTPNANANTHVTANANAGGSNMNGAANVNRPNTNANANANTSTAGADLPHVQVADIFAADRVARINATTRLIVERKQDGSAVKQAVQSALAHPDNKSGVINTLVYLENADPALLKQNRGDILKLFDLIKDNGSQTVEHIKKVQERMGG